MNTLVAPLVEAWGEVKVQKMRVILSLIGVAAAVAAVSTVIALGQILNQSTKEMVETYRGRSTTITLTPRQTGTSSSEDSSASQFGGPQDEGGAVPGGETDNSAQEGGVVTGQADSASSSQSEGDQTSLWPGEAGGDTSNPAASAIDTVADRFKLPYWSRSHDDSIKLAELDQVKKTGTFRGKEVKRPALGDEAYSMLQVKAVDPGYATIYNLRIVQGRWLQANDADQRVMPIVINYALWTYFGKPDLSTPWIMTSSNDANQKYRVVGISHSSAWDTPTVYAPFDGWAQSKGASRITPSMVVWASPEQAVQAQSDLKAALSSALGDGWKVSARTGSGGSTGEMNSAFTIIMAIGSIVIALGALGLLNVALVTVRQRIREIGIRRAMGASARRIFFAVFLESVVATFIAGVIGMAIAIVVLRFIPLESFDIVLLEPPPFPISAAVAGVGIATAVGALCGIIPAFASVKVRPIDAIRQ
ncbi:MAG: ABC transporter permease [Actinomycetaceae bacterium]|nr:ABC transporter permease [Actinomycetaceae bacterium]